MSVRPFNSETDASITHVELVARPANGDEGGGDIVPHVWIPVLGSSIGNEAYESVDAALEALNEAGWLHLPVMADIRLSDFSYDTPSDTRRVTLFDPGKGPYRKYLLKDAGLSVREIGADELEISCLARDGESAEVGKACLIAWSIDGDDARALKSLLESDVSAHKKLSEAAQQLNIDYIMDPVQSNDHVKTVAGGGREEYLQVNMFAIDEGSGSPFVYWVTADDSKWHSRVDVDETFGNLEEARQFVSRLVQEADLSPDPAEPVARQPGM